MITIAKKFFVAGDKETNDQVLEALNNGLSYQIQKLKLLKEIQDIEKLKKDTKLQIKLAEESLMKEYKWYKKMVELNVPYWFRSMSAERIKEKEHTLNKLTLRNSFETGVKQGLSPASINNAKNYPIENLLEINSRNFALCPFHEDSKPSFYCKNNFGHCFSCGTTADVIDIAMKVFNLSFKDAINKLNNK